MHLGTLLVLLTCEAMSTASCCMSSGMSAFLMTALRSDMARFGCNKQASKMGYSSEVRWCAQQL